MLLGRLVFIYHGNLRKINFSLKKVINGEMSLNVSYRCLVSWVKLRKEQRILAYFCIKHFLGG